MNPLTVVDKRTDNFLFTEQEKKQDTPIFYLSNHNYKFNGKELDANTGLYYYGARYFDPRISNWLSVDPIALWQPVQESEHYIEGQHNGGVFNPKNLSVYGYTYQNPIVYVDPNGKQNYFAEVNKEIGKLEQKVNSFFRNILGGEKSKSAEVNTVGAGEHQLIIKAGENCVCSYPGESIDLLVTKGIQWVGGQFTGDEVSEETANNVQLGTDIAIIIASKGKNAAADERVVANGFSNFNKSAGKNYIYIGGVKLVKETFHNTIKKNILKDAGDFMKKVGKNPNINVKNGNIILEGQGSFKGKTFETTLKSKDYLK